MSVPNNPFDDLDRLFRQMSRQFETAAQAWQRGDPVAALAGGSLSVDVVETDETFRVTVDLPGYEQDDVDVRISDRTLSVTAERERTDTEETARYVRKERQHGTVEREVRLPAAIDAEAVSAEMAHGVLTVTVPKSADVAAKHIEVS